MTRKAAPEVPPGLFVAVIGDLVASRDLPDRAAIQERLRATLVDLDEHFEEHVASRFLITLGDEFQGLLRPSVPLDELFWRYQRQMHGVAETRFAFGVGRLATPLQPEAIGMDGPCFHAARAALMHAYEEGRRLTFQLVDEPLLGEVMNVAGSLLDSLLARWTPTQWETVTLLDELGTQEAVAERRGVRRQSVGDVVQSSLGHECIAAWSGLAAVIGRYAIGGAA